MKLNTFESAALTLRTSDALVADSLALASGEFWLTGASGQEPTVEYVEAPDSEWAKRVDAIEAPFAAEYDVEEYKNPALRMLNLAELGMLAEAVGVQLPWLRRPGGRELSGKRWLDIGCGTGRIALFGVGVGADVVALDPTDEYVNITAGKARRLPGDAPRPRLLVTPAEALPDGQANIVTAMFGVLNHCQNWQEVFTGLTKRLVPGGVFAGSFYGSPEAAVYEEIANGLPYEPAILTRRTKKGAEQSGIYLGKDSDVILPAAFPYPAELLSTLRENGMTIQQVQPFLSVTALYPSDPTPDNIAAYVGVIRRRYGVQISAYLERYQEQPLQLLVASLCADYMVPAERINEAAYYGVIATKGDKK